MKIVFVSNFLNHHQIALCEALRKRCEDFYFIATQEIKNIGFQKSTDAEYVVKYYSNEERIRVETLIIDADAVIFGACPNELIERRMKENKLSFLFSERFLKKGVWRRFIPRTRRAIHDRIAKYYDKRMYGLCASAYLSYDLSFFGFPQDKCLKWGYFPAIKTYEDINEVLRQKKKASILWVGRLIEWKHPEMAVLLAKYLKKMGYVFCLNIIGSGPLEAKLLKRIKKEKLEDCVHMLGAMSPEEVRNHMEQSELFLFTSDRYEGWGAVLNEAMNSGCSVVANHIIGSVSFLIEDAKNGLIYKNGNLSSLCKKVKWLLDNPGECSELGKKAYQTITNQWNAENAADRLCRLIEDVYNGDIELYQKGVCSRADVIKENWYR